MRMKVESDPTFQPMGDRCLIIEFESRVDPEINCALVGFSLREPGNLDHWQHQSTPLFDVVCSIGNAVVILVGNALEQ